MKTFTKKRLTSLSALTLFAVALASCQKEVTPEIQRQPSGLQQTNHYKTAAVGNAATYELIWSEDFATSLDTTKWKVVTGSQDEHHELQAFDSTAIKAQDGNLSILADKRPTYGKDYRSGKISTQGKFSIQFGRVEARIKLPYAIGIGCEINMQGINYPEVGLPASGEIDIMQHVNRDFNALGGIQWDNAGHAIYRGASPATVAPGYHVYAVEWDAKEIRWYLDGKQYWTANIADGINSTDEFQKPFFINVDMFVGGDLAGMNVDRNLPTSMGVDYIKVYKLTGSKVQ